MLKDITIGQYYKEDSLIHRLDPRVKLFAVLIYVITLFMHKAPATYVMSLLFLIITIKISKVPVKYILRGLKAIAVILLFSVMINMLFIPGKPVIHSEKDRYDNFYGIHSAKDHHNFGRATENI